MATRHISHWPTTDRAQPPPRSQSGGLMSAPLICIWRWMRVCRPPNEAVSRPRRSTHPPPPPLPPCPAHTSLYRARHHPPRRRRPPPPPLSQPPRRLDRLCRRRRPVTRQSLLPARSPARWPGPIHLGLCFCQSCMSFLTRVLLHSPIATVPSAAGDITKNYTSFARR